MKKQYQLLLFSLLFYSASLLTGNVKAQCTNSQLNWDYLDYVYNSGGTGPYENYVTNALEQTQRFAIGRTWLSIVTSHADLVNPGSPNYALNTTHTGNITGFEGADVQYNPSANGQTITITFNSQVQNTSFALYDIDNSARIDVDAYNSSNVAQNVAVTTYSSTILTVTNNSNINTYVTASSTNLTDNSSNQGSATFSVSNLINRIVITVTTRGSDVVFWLSDINACVDNGNFPTNWHQQANNRPFVGPTQNMPDYFLVTPDNDVSYYVDPATGNTRQLFQDTERDYVNSFGYDPYNRNLYYITENLSVNANNKTIKKFNYDTETSGSFVANITTTLGIPTFNQGIESAGCSFYDGAIYLGIEGGKYDVSGTASDRTRKTIIWRIDLDGSGNALVAYQVMALNAYNPASINTSIHDWGDFIIKNGVIYDFNTARSSCGTGCYDYTQSKYHHYNMVTGQMINEYSNSGSSQYSGQAGMTWAGGLYYFRPATSGSTSVIGTYNEAGGVGSPVTINVVSGTAWPGGSGDASDPFRPKCDFGDAPSSYDPYADPATQSPAVHENSENIRLGATWDREFWKRGTAGTDDTDDGISIMQFLNPGGGGYVAQASVFNNSGGNATLIAWLDYNGNGLFDASEATTPITVPSSASNQNFYLYWPSTTNPFINGQYTYMRVRITAASAGMNTNHPTGYFANGEVEDYLVIVDNYPLKANIISFNASQNQNVVSLKWTVSEDAGTYEYEVERSFDNNDWMKIGAVRASGVSRTFEYQYEDLNPGKGYNYYRIRIIESSGMNRFSAVKKVLIKDISSTFSVSPNPAKENISVKFELPAAADVVVSVLNQQGAVIITRPNKGLAGWNKIDFNLPAQLPQGTYVVKINIGELNISKKIIVRK